MFRQTIYRCKNKKVLLFALLQPLAGIYPVATFAGSALVDLRGAGGSLSPWDVDAL